MGFDFSDAVARIKPSPTVAVTQMVAQMKADGHDVIGLGAGEPDFDTPAHIRAAGIAAIDGGQTRYTAPDGIAELKEAICEKFARENELTYKPENISVASGGKQILFNAMLALLDPGDEVIIPCPYWVSYPDIVAFAGATPVFLRPKTGAGLKITPAQLEAAITKQTRCVVLNSPSNPSGVCYSRDEIARLADILVEHPQVWIISDDIYEPIVYEPTTFATIAQTEPRLMNRTLTLNGVSKAYAMTGWRIGYAGGPKPLIDQMRKIQSQSTSNPCSISQHASVVALNGSQEFLSEWRVAFRRRRDFVVGALNSMDGIDCPSPDGAFYVYPSIEGLIGKTTPQGMRLENDEDFVAALLREQGVATVFGAAFGLSPHFRISYATSDEVLAQACTRIGKFVSDLT